ncbi:MAG: glycoside hydrolase family 18 protein [Chryseolinea sp.]
MNAKHTTLSIVLLLVLGSTNCVAQTPASITVTAYFMGREADVDSVAADKLTHIIFSFLHLKGNVLQVDNPEDASTITSLVALKKKNPALKILLSLGGWGGCETCADVFSTSKGRKDFAQSVLQLNQFFKTDGIDIDWEYPAIEGYPGHKFGPSDKQNFTDLILELRQSLGTEYEISFAAGGFRKFLDESVEWKKIIDAVDRVNLMTYDLVNGFSKVTGHHTPLYSNTDQKESTDNAVKYLIKMGLPANKLVIGAAFYGRMWEDVPATNNGLYQSGKFKAGVNYDEFDSALSVNNGWKHYWDNVSKAPYAYNAGEKLFITYDDAKSMEVKVKYTVDARLNGIMFWEINNDKSRGGLLDAIDKVKQKYRPKAK